VKECQFESGQWSLSTTAANETLSGLVSLIGADGNEFLELRISRPTLEEAFHSITEGGWTDRADGGV
jgi:hypothetical protein